MEKLKKINAILDKVNKKGNTGIKVASELKSFGFLKTPFTPVNMLIGGLPNARFSTLAGPEHTGKGVFCLQTIAYQQAEDPDFVALWTDAENAFDEDWARNLGVDLDRLIIQKYNQKINTMELLLDNALHLIKESKAINMWVIDSIGALIPRGDIYTSKGEDKSLESTNMLHLQRKLGEFYRKANVIISPDEESGYNGCAVLLIGQIYCIPDAHVTLEAVKGGNAVKHWAHLRLLFRRGPKADGPEPIKLVGIDGKERKVYPGWCGRIKVDKTRINDKEGQEVLLQFRSGVGFDSKIGTINVAFGLELITRAGAWYSCDLFPEGKVQGKEEAIKFLMENEEAFEELEKRVQEAAAIVHSDDLEEV